MSGRTRRMYAWALAALIGFGQLAGGCGDREGRTPREAFALSASALSGQDRFAFEGELTVIGPDGRTERRTRYRGQVDGHRPSVLQWGGAAAAEQAEPAARGRGAGRSESVARPGAWAAEPDEDDGHPLALAAALQAGPAAIEFAPGQGTAVALRITLDPAAARLRAEAPLRRALAALRRERVRAAEASPGDGARMRRFEQEERRLREMLATLRASTVCVWSADRRTWFPRELREETTLSYRQGGRDVTVKRTAVTNFRRKPAMVQ